MADKFDKIKMKKLNKEIETITKRIKEINALQKKLNPNESHQYIIEQHCYGCRCPTCWYQFDGEKWSHIKINSIYTDIYNSNQRFYTD